LPDRCYWAGLVVVGVVGADGRADGIDRLYVRTPGDHGPPCLGGPDAPLWPSGAPGAGGVVVSSFGAGVHRGVMTVDRFTQVANALSRDSRLSFKAKGIFRCVSTRRTGWPVTIADLVRVGPDGREAGRTGPRELEAHGYLVRERLRRPDGALGEIVQCSNDQPATLDIPDTEADLVIAPLHAGHAGGFGP
jgi:hypothetical protein